MGAVKGSYVGTVRCRSTLHAGHSFVGDTTAKGLRTQIANHKKKTKIMRTKHTIHVPLSSAGIFGPFYLSTHEELRCSSKASKKELMNCLTSPPAKHLFWKLTTPQNTYHDSDDILG